MDASNSNIFHKFCLCHSDVYIPYNLAVFQVSATWWGRSHLPMTETMELFWMHTVKPSIECEPGHGLKESYLNKLVDFLSAEPGTSSQDLELVKQICTGKIQRNPVLHGVAFRSFNKSFIFSGRSL